MTHQAQTDPNMNLVWGDAELTASDLESKLRELSRNNEIFAVTFTKRTTGEERSMLCRFNVRKYVNGKGRKYTPNDKGLVGVFDVVNDGHRMINVPGIKRITIQGETYTVK